MKGDSIRREVLNTFLILFGSAAFAFGFDIFLVPNSINGGGLTGLMQIFCSLTGFGSVGTLVLICNVPLFFLGRSQIGRRFFWGSLLGMLSSSVLIDLFPLFLSGHETETLLAALYGGLLTGFGLGLVFRSGASTGGMDIVARLLRRRLPHVPIGRLVLGTDLFVVALTGLAFRNLDKALYSAVALYVSTLVMDMVIYGRNDSGVALVISDRHKEVADVIERRLGRGATLLPGAGAYTGRPKTVVLCAVKNAQVVQLKKLVAEVDPDAFVILQKAHQVLGDGFSRYADEW